MPYSVAAAKSCPDCNGDGFDPRAGAEAEAVSVACPIEVELDVRRLTRAYASWWRSSIYARMCAADLVGVTRATEWVREDRRGGPHDYTYDLGRVAHFVDVLAAGGELDSIDVESVGSGVALHDGHHRFAAHVLAQRVVVRARYVGRVDVLERLRPASPGGRGAKKGGAR